jgi:hypothetical protein
VVSKDNIIKFPERAVTDNVCRLASAVSRVMELSDLENPEDHLTALFLVQTAVQKAIVEKEGPAGLRRCLVLANEKRGHYQIRWNYNPKR